MIYLSLGRGMLIDRIAAIATELGAQAKIRLTSDGAILLQLGDAGKKHASSQYLVLA